MLGIGVFGFLYISFFNNFTVDLDTSEFILKQTEWTTDLVTNFKDNATFYLGSLALLTGVGYFFFKKK